MSLPNTVVPAPVGTLLVRQGSRRPIVAFALRENDSPLPITSLLCWACEKHVIPLHHAAVAGPRVDGDSRYGFSAMHTACTEVGEALSR